MRFTKTKTFLATVALITSAITLPGIATAEPEKRHALSLVGKPKYGPDFKHFNFVNPNAPKGGLIRTWMQGTYESLNPFPATQGNAAIGLGGLVFESLMTGSIEEPSAEYGLIAEWASYPDDFSSVTFKLREEAKFHDGKQITVEDVIFSFKSLVKVNVQIAHYYKNVKEVKKTGDREVTFYFDVKNNKELPQIMGQLTIIPKHFWTGKDSKGNPRDISQSTLEFPLGSGPYKVKTSLPGKSITYERVKDYWAKDLPVNKGQYNFDEIQYYYFKDTNIAMEAFKAGKLDYIDVNHSKIWATGFNFTALKQGHVRKHVVPEKGVRRMQAFTLNTRRDYLSDPRVRRALNLAFDFEWSNKNLFYNQYSRLNSYFEGSELAATGLPEGRELEILNEVKDQIPPEVFTKEYKQPINGDTRTFRKNLRKAFKLLKEAGWTVKKNQLINTKTGKAMQLEFLLSSPAFERIVLPYIQNLEQLGIKAKIRVVDVAQYKRRTDNFEFDIVIGQFPQSMSPGNEQRAYWSSTTADLKGSNNLIGIKNPAIDKLIDKVILAKDRAELVAATRALDRVLQWNHYVVPNWYAPYERISFWDKFAYPKSLNVLPPECLGECMKKARAQPGKIYTSSAGALTTWWSAPKTDKK